MFAGLLLIEPDRIPRFTVFFFWFHGVALDCTEFLPSFFFFNWHYRVFSWVVPCLIGAFLVAMRQNWGCYRVSQWFFLFVFFYRVFRCRIWPGFLCKRSESESLLCGRIFLLLPSFFVVFYPRSNVVKLDFFFWEPRWRCRGFWSWEIGAVPRTATRGKKTTAANHRRRFGSICVRDQTTATTTTTTTKNSSNDSVAWRKRKRISLDSVHSLYSASNLVRSQRNPVKPS